MFNWILLIIIVILIICDIWKLEAQMTRTGGPAFPAEIDGNTVGIQDNFHEKDMTLRDYFAAKAMTMFHAGTAESIALKAYALADAMIKKRG